MKLSTFLLATAAVLLLAACGTSANPTVTPNATGIPITVPTAAPSATSVIAGATIAATAAPALTGAPTVVPTATAAPTVSGPRKAGQYGGIRFAVSSGSAATFTVKEQLSRLPLPNDAVMRTSGLSGEVRLDGPPSTVTINLQSLTSDDRQRDQYVRTTMFGRTPTATFTLPSALPLPAGFADGKQVDTKSTGTLNIGGKEVPLTWETQVRDDGSVVFVLAKTDFTWTQIGVAKPQAQSVLSVDDTVHVEILLSLKPA